jgi:hypothetical protein
VRGPNNQEHPYIIDQALLVVPQNASDTELCLRITGVTTTLPLFINAIEAKLKTTVVIAQRCLPRLGLLLRARNIDRLIAPFGASFDRGNNCCVVKPNVKRKQSSLIEGDILRPIRHNHSRRMIPSYNEGEE